YEAFDWDSAQAGLPIDMDGAAPNTRALTPMVSGAAPEGTGEGETVIAPSPPAAEPAEPVVAGPCLDSGGNALAEAASDSFGAWSAWLGDGLLAAAPAEDIDPAQILRDRPDVYAGFYRDFYGPNNDRNSPAWVDRVGGETPEDYARYWYEAHGRFEGYTPGSGLQGAPVEGADEAPAGRTTIDGIPLSKILSDRPDVFQAFFTEYYGPNNDRNSDAWVQRVGGSTVEDYANYWYNAHGKVGGYVPSGSGAARDPAPDPVAAPGGDGGLAPLPAEDPSLDPWNHPAIYPDWQPPYPGWRPPSGGSGDAAPADEIAPQAEDPFVYSDPEAPMLRIPPGQSLFDGSGV
ncbi:hypothetical protein, partial [Phenylobacterium sp. CCH12-B4]